MGGFEKAEVARLEKVMVVRREVALHFIENVSELMYKKLHPGNQKRDNLRF